MELKSDNSALNFIIRLCNIAKDNAWRGQIGFQTSLRHHLFVTFLRHKYYFD